MSEPLLDQLRSRFHGLIAEENRNDMYLRAPDAVQRLWDRLGEKPEPSNIPKLSESRAQPLGRELTENDVLFAIRFYWFHEPSAEMVQRWYTQKSSLNFDINGLAHDLQYSPEALNHEAELKNSRVPDDPDYVKYAHRILLRRNPTEKERELWLEKLRKTDWSLEAFVASFENSDEYRQRLKAEAEPHLVEFDRFKVYVRLGDYFISAPIAHSGDYEVHVSPLIDKFVRPGDYAIDIGANVGYHAMHLASIVGETGKVFAFEPFPDNCELIELSVEANGFTNLTLLPYAAGDAAGEIEIIAEGDQTNARMITNPVHDVPTARRFIVEVVKIDDLLADIPRLRFVKIDAEGAEPLIVTGMSDLLARYKPVLLFEFFPDVITMVSQSDPQQFLDQIIDLGYRLYVIGQPPLLTEVSDSAHAMRLREEIGHYMMDMLALPNEMEDFPVA